MAYTLGQRKNGPDLTASAAAPTPAQGTSASAPQNGATAPTPAASGPTLGQGGYVNFQNYLGLDSGAGQQMANKVAGSVNSAAGAARNQISQDSNAFGAKVSAGTPTFSPISPTLINPQNPYFTPRMPAEPLDGPQETGKTGYQPKGGQTFNATPLNRHAYGQAAQQAQQAGQNATYSGPGDISGAFDGSLGALGALQTQTQALKTPGGLAASLQGAYGGQSTQGGLALDAALAGSVGAKTLSAAGNAYGDLMNQLGVAQSNANQQIAGAQGAAANVAGQYQNEANRFGQLATEQPYRPTSTVLPIVTYGPQGLPKTPPASYYPGKHHHG